MTSINVLGEKNKIMEVYLFKNQLSKYGQAQIIIVTYQKGKRVEETFHVKLCEDGKPALVVKGEDFKPETLKECFW